MADVRFDGRVFLVTGAGRGLGRAVASLLAARGAKVVVGDNGATLDGTGSDSRPAEAVAADIRAAGGEAIACTADIATEHGSSDAVSAALDAFGHIDGLVHNASNSPDLATVDQLSSGDLDAVMRINPFAGLWLARAAWPHMVGRRFGRILYSTSAGIYGSLGNAHYAAAKAAYIGLLRCLAIEGVPHGICVNGIAPAAMTRMTERLEPSAYTEWFSATMAPEKVAVGAAWLMSDECQVNGEILALGGGRIARILLAESEGVIGSGASIEEVRDAMPRVMSDDRIFMPGALSERSRKVASLFGFDGALEASDRFAVRPAEKN